MVSEQGVKDLMRHEGFRSRVYRDTKDIPTIGYGYNLEANCENLSTETLKGFYLHGITKEFAKQLLLGELNDLEHKLEEKLPFWGRLSQTRRDVLCNMAFNLGVEGLFDFKKTLSFVGQKRYSDAAVEMLCSKWAKDVGDRADYLSLLMKVGEYK